MTLINWIGLGMLIVEIVACIGLRRHAIRKVRAMDGLGKVRKYGDRCLVELGSDKKKR